MKEEKIENKPLPVLKCVTEEIRRADGSVDVVVKVPMLAIKQLLDAKANGEKV